MHRGHPLQGGGGLPGWGVEGGRGGAFQLLEYQMVKEGGQI